MSKVSPCKEDNAIKNVAYAFEFTAPLPYSVVHNVTEMYKKDAEFSNALPRMQPIESYTIQVGAQGGQNPTTSTVGVMFDRLSPKGEQDWAVILRPDAFIVSCAQYTRWEDIYTKAKSYIVKIAPYLHECTLSAIALEYLDEFNIDNFMDPEWPSELFNLNSKHLTSNVINSTGGWHLHQGYWDIFHHYESSHKCLINIDLDCLEEAYGNVTRIRHLQKVFTSDVINLQNALDTGFFDDLFFGNHEGNLRFIRDILSKEMLSKINAGGK